MRLLHARDADDARALLDENPNPSDEEIRTAISGSICRCTGYKNIVGAIRWAADREADETGGVSMAVVENLPSPGAERPIGFGRLKRKEDERFIRGQGTYLDDIELPGCCTARCCGARTRTRGSSPSTPRRRSSTPTSPRS